ncbi:DUF1501 domain-containing protein [Agrobacterium sp. a22-2]|nr:DUF1501 domain-containing protein [Agrobacterium sp. a22-2]NKN37622.1 DUF1501 domain-containing protein [Agrobacterium sp. a22-2]
MSDRTNLSRRGFIASACCLAAAPVFTPLTFAAMPGDNRFVAIVLRGAMDGLALVQPYGDPLLKQLRPDLVVGADAGLLDLDGFFGLHPAAADLMPLWKAGELSFVHSVSTPYRNARSHFDGQDILETGGSSTDGLRSGWLNRTLSVMAQPTAAVDVSTSRDLILAGPNKSEVWSTQSDVTMDGDALQFLTRLYENDPVFATAMAEAVSVDGFSDKLYGDTKRGQGVHDVARLAGGLLREQYRVAAFSISGWDTHIRQAADFAKAAKQLALAITTLKETLGPEAWSKTAVVAMTEFGRTVRQNGSAGTDHGTGGCCVMAGGAIKGGRVLGRWAGLGDGDLLDGRDLMPTGDVREVAAAMLYRQFDVPMSALTSTIFPGLDFSNRSAYL